MVAAEGNVFFQAKNTACSEYYPSFQVYQQGIFPAATYIYSHDPNFQSDSPSVFLYKNCTHLGHCQLVKILNFSNDCVVWLGPMLQALVRVSVTKFGVFFLLYVHPPGPNTGG